MGDKQRGDLGNGYYLNPILAGDWPDPSVLRVGEDYYMTHTTCRYAPTLLIWHSLDLVNWQPVGHAVQEYAGNVYAPEFIRHQDRFYIYYPDNTRGTNFVVHAPSPTGPWSKPIDLKVGKIDPGHVVGPDGKRYLHFSAGMMAELADDGLSMVGEMRKVYDGWPIPKDWPPHEGIALESPKLIFRDGYYYLTSAQGGTAGPATSHMVISARSRAPWGPWENSPYNPIVHTASRDETWWSRGHGTLVEAVDGSWWILYHAYRKGFHTLGRHVLMEPIEWTADGWFRVPPGIRVDQPIRKPPGQALPHGLKLSDDFAGPQLGLQWRCLGGIEPGRVTLAGGAMVMQGRGQAAADSNPLVCMPTDAAYEAQVELTLRGGQGGMVVYYNSEYFGGIGMGADGVFRMRRNRVMKPAAPWESRAVRLRIVNDRHEVRFYHSADGQVWDAGLHTIETSGFHHNTLGGFLGLRVGLYAAGDGAAEFRNFRYRTMAE